MSTDYQPRYVGSAALIIGIDEYQFTGPLANACCDAKSVAEVLVRDLNFPPDKVWTLMNADASRANIMERYLSFDSLSRDDRLFVFFAGHGTTALGQRGPIGYLVPVDGKESDKS